MLRKKLEELRLQERVSEETLTRLTQELKVEYPKEIQVYSTQQKIELAHYYNEIYRKLKQLGRYIPGEKREWIGRQIGISGRSVSKYLKMEI